MERAKARLARFRSMPWRTIRHGWEISRKTAKRARRSSVSAVKGWPIAENCFPKEAEAPFADEMSRAFRDGDPDRAVALLAPMKAAARAAQVARLAAKKNEGAKARTGENRRTDAN